MVVVCGVLMGGCDLWGLDGWLWSVESCWVVVVCGVLMGGCGLWGLDGWLWSVEY